MKTAPPVLPLLLAAGCVVAGPASAQERRPQVFGVDVRVVAVPVFVTDKSGQSVAGLTRDDFEVEDQGRKVPVTGFLAVDAGAATAELPTGSSPALAAASRRQFLLLFDLTFSTPTGLMKARQAAVELLENGPQPGDLVAVASLGTAGLQVHTAFTSDRGQAAHAVATLGATGNVRLRDPLGLAYDFGLPLTETTGRFGLEFTDAAPDDLIETLRQLARAERAQYRQYVVNYVAELQGLGKLLDSVQGRKQVVLLSAGFDQSLLTGAQSTEQAESARSVAEGRLWEVQGDRHFGDAVARSTLDGLFQALTRSDTVVHTVDVTGLGAGGGGLDEMANIPAGSGRETLAQLAGRSGGRFIRQTNDLAGALREVLAASRHYYVVAFEPVESKKKPGELRKLKVRVKRPALEVSHRASYVLASADTSAQARQLSAADVLAKGLSGGALRLSALPVPYRIPEGRVTLPVVLEVEGAGLLADGGKGPISLEVYAYALDGEGRILDALGLTPTLDLQAVGPLVERKGVQVLTSFRVQPGPVDLRFLVRDAASGRAGSLRIATTVPAFGAGALVLSPPLLMDDPRARVVIPAASMANPELEIPFRVEDAAFTPQAKGALRNGQAQQVCVMAIGIPQGAELRIEAELVAEGGSAIPLQTGPARTVADPDGYSRLVLAVTPRSVPPGDYRLRLKVNGSGTPETAVRVE